MQSRQQDRHFFLFLKPVQVLQKKKNSCKRLFLISSFVSIVSVKKVPKCLPAASVVCFWGVNLVKLRLDGQYTVFTMSLYRKPGRVLYVRGVGHPESCSTHKACRCACETHGPLQLWRNELVHSHVPCVLLEHFVFLMLYVMKYYIYEKTIGRLTANVTCRPAPWKYNVKFKIFALLE